MAMLFLEEVELLEAAIEVVASFVQRVSREAISSVRGRVGQIPFPGQYLEI